MASIDNLSIKISASVGPAIKAIEGLTKSLEKLNETLNAIDPSVLDSISKAAAGMESMTKGTKSTAASMKTLSGEIVNFKKAASSIKSVSNDEKDLANAQRKWGQGLSEITSAFRNLGATGRSGSEGVRQVANATKDVSTHASNSSRNIKHFAKSTNEASKTAKGFAKELTRIGKMLKLMITRMVLRKVIQGVLDGFKNLAQYSSTFDASLSLLWNSFRQLGNSIAAAVSPLLNALAPALNYIIQLVIKVVNVINQLISALTGMGTWTRAKTLTDDYAKSLDKSNKSAKELKKTVLGFDELNQLQDNKSGGNSGTSPKDMFENVPIDPRILEFVDNLKKKIGELKKYWDAFLDGFKRGLGDDWKNKVNLIKDGILRIKDALKDIWDDPAVSKSRERYFLSLSRMLGTVAGTVVRIGLNIGANLAQGIAGALEEKSPEIKEYLVEMFDIGTSMNDQISEFSLAIGRISDVLVGDNAIAATQGFAELFTESFMLITENAARTGNEVLKLLTQPIIDNQDSIAQAFDGMFGALATLADFAQSAVKDLRDILSDVWNQHLSPMFDSLTKGLSSIVAALTDAWNNNINPVLQELMNELKPLWEQYIKPIADDIMHIIGIIGNLIAKLFQTVIAPYFTSLVQKYFPEIKDGMSLIISVAKSVLQWATLIIEHITFLLRSFLQFFETGFTKGWGTACEELSKSWSQHWDDMLEKLKGVANSIIEVVEKLINGIAHGINRVVDKVGGMADIPIPSIFGGGTFTFSGFKALHLNDVSLPRFAGGGFPQQGSMFLAGESGAELVGNINGRTAVANNEQITDGIAQAVFNAMIAANSGNNGERYINNTIYIGEEQIARAVTKGQEKLNRRYSPTMA